MQCYVFDNGKPLRALEALPEQLPASGFAWLDIQRSDTAVGWEQQTERLAGVSIAPQHVADSHNASHPSFFDGTADYDMLVFQGLAANGTPLPIETRNATFFLFERLLVTVRAPDSISFSRCLEKLGDGRSKRPTTPLSLAHRLLDTIVDSHLALREPLTQIIGDMQDRLLDPDSHAHDWKALLRVRREVRRLTMLSEGQREALEFWRRGTRKPWSAQLAVRMRDIDEHLLRMSRLGQSLEHDLESAVDLHFSAVAHRTNRIVQTLTGFSVIFLPLTLMAGIWGMNFEYMPELKTHYGYYFALGSIAAVGGLLYVLLRRRGYF